MTSSQTRQGGQSQSPAQQQQQQGSTGTSHQQGGMPVQRFTDWASI